MPRRYRCAAGVTGLSPFSEEAGSGRQAGCPSCHEEWDVTEWEIEELCFSQNKSLFVSAYRDVIVQYAYFSRPLAFKSFSSLSGVSFND